MINIFHPLDFDANTIYNTSISIKKGCVNMSTSNKLQDFLSKNGSIITTTQANAIGISNERLRLFVNSGVLERAAYGIYISPDEYLDKMYVAQVRRSKMIYSHETALFLHDLTDRDPISYSVTVPTGYNAKAIIDEDITVYSIKKDIHMLGVVQMETIFTHSVTVYGLERTICDCIRSRNKMDIAVVTESLKRYVKRNDKNLNTLMEMAKVFRIEKILRTYMEVLL